MDPVLLELGLGGSRGKGEDDVLKAIGLTDGTSDMLTEHSASKIGHSSWPAVHQGTVTGVGPSMVATEETSLGLRLGGGHYGRAYNFVLGA